MKIEKNLLRLCMKGDRRAQNKLYEDCFDLMYSICWRYEKNAEDARHVLNIGFMKIITNLEKMPEDANFEHWASRIMINANIDEYRKNKRRKSTIMYDDLDLNNTTYEEVIVFGSDYEFTSEILEKMINSLPDTMRKIFNLFAIDGFSHKEISEMLDIPVSTSKSTLCKARKKLKEKLEKYKKSTQIKVS